MARIRSVKPELRTDLTVAAWPFEVRYAWVLLWGYLDDHGRGRDDMRLVVADLFPLDRSVTEKKVDGWLRIMETVKADDDNEPPLCRYEVRGQHYLHAVNWTKHQRVSHPNASNFPSCPVHDDLTTDSGIVHESVVNRSVVGREPVVPSRAPDEQGAGSKEKGVRSRPEPTRLDVDRLCNRLVELMVERNCRKPVVTARWKESARLLLDRDKVPLADALRVLEWSQRHTFWRANILSMPKFREKYDQLRQQAEPEEHRPLQEWIEP